MINRALVLPTQSPSRDGRGGESVDLAEHRRILKTKLLTFFGLGLVTNVINVFSYTLAFLLFPQYFNELNYISSCAIVGYIVLNLYLLDMLRDGVLNPVDITRKKKKRYVDSSIDRGINGSANDYPEMFEDLEMQENVLADYQPWPHITGDPGNAGAGPSRD
jgi:hypothetical protein